MGGDFSFSVLRHYTNQYAIPRSSRCHDVIGDRYGGEWPRERFRAAGINYKLSEHPKGEIYRDTLPLLNSGKLELLDMPRLASQLCGLERRTARGGRDSIDHGQAGTMTWRTRLVARCCC